MGVDSKMNTEILSDIRNKLTVPMVALERLEKSENVPKKFLKLALKELEMSQVFSNPRMSMK